MYSECNSFFGEYVDKRKLYPQGNTAGDDGGIEKAKAGLP